MPDYDTIVIGAGYAGLSAALKLAKEGQRVLLLAKGHGGTHLKKGTIDILGYHAGKRVQHPLDTIAELRKTNPSHPYALLPEQDLRDAARFFQDAMDEAGYPFEGTVEQNVTLPTALGVARPTALAPQTMISGQMEAGRTYLIVGFSNFKDFYPDLIADNLRRLLPGLQARSIMIDAPGFENEADLPPLTLAHAFDEIAFREALVATLRPHLKPGERIGFPAVLGLDKPSEVLSHLQTQLGTEVFEIPTLPPSIPGIRVYHAFEGLLRKHGVRIQIGHPVVEVQAQGHRIESVSVQSAVRLVVYSARDFILATGGLISGGLAVDSYQRVGETVFDLPLVGVPEPAYPQSRISYFEDQPLSGMGVLVDGDMRPLDLHGDPVYSNLRACGALVARTDTSKEKSSEGISLATAYRAAQSIISSRRAEFG